MKAGEYIEFFIENGLAAQEADFFGADHDVLLVLLTLLFLQFRDLT